MRSTRHGSSPRSSASSAGSPSRWSERLPLAALATCGLAVASYLALVQLGVVGRPWDPLFGSASSARVLRSAFSRSLPFPDAAAGALAYALEALLAVTGGHDRWRSAPWIVAAYGAVAAGLGAGSVGLILVQALVVGSGCALCLGSAAISIAIAAVAQREVRAAIGVLRGRDRSHQHA
jgi:uncharacterized membrane protein